MKSRRNALREATFDRSFTGPADEQLPDDYEPCGDCGYDHSYEPRESKQWHDTHGPRVDEGRRSLRRLIAEEIRHALREGPKGNPQSEPEFGTLLDALAALQAKGFSPDDVMRTALELSPRRRGT